MIDELLQRDIEFEEIMYVYESAEFEVLIGNNEFAAVMEAAANQAAPQPQQQNNLANAKDPADEGWFAKLRRSVMTFIRSASEAIKRKFTEMGNNKRRENVKARMNKVKNSFQGGNRTGISVTPDQRSILTNGLINASLDNFLNTLKGALKEASRNGRVDPGWNERYKNAFSAAFNGKNTGHAYTATAGDIMQYLNNSRRQFNMLEKAFNNANSYINNISAENEYTRSQIRLAISFAYNYVTKAVRQYYTVAMNLANQFTMND